MRSRTCSNPRYSWVTYFKLSDICNFSQLVRSILSTHPLFALSIFVTLSIPSPLVIYSLFTLSSHPINSPTVHITQHNSLSCLIVRTLSALIYLSYSPGVFGHRVILLWGGGIEAWLGGFVLEHKRYPTSSFWPAFLSCSWAKRKARLYFVQWYTLVATF